MIENKEIIGLFESKASIRYKVILLIALILTIYGVFVAYYSIENGLGVWGIHNSVSWGFAIINFVFWIGIGHAGTLISAILFLFNQSWRTPISRLAETMTIISVICAAIFPLLHTGRPWYAMYWLFPYPNEMGLWVNFSSPLVWDIFAIFSYFIISTIFWYFGMIPDFQIATKYCKRKYLRRIYNFLGLGWSGSQNQWQAYIKTYTILAGIATALVISVHTIVSLDFAVTKIPGWHSTIFPVYFVAGAIFSGCAMVCLIIIIARNTLKMKSFIRTEHIDKLSKIMLGTGWILIYTYFFEYYFADYSNHYQEQFTIMNRLTGEYAWIFWTMFAMNSISIQVLWFQKFRSNQLIVFIISLLVIVGMWLERFVIVISSQYKSFLPHNWEIYIPTWVDYSILIGSFGFFIFMYLLAVRFIPMLPIWEYKSEESRVQND